MRRVVSQVTAPVVVATLVLMWMLATGTPDRDVALRLWLVAMGLVGARVVVATLPTLSMAPRRDRFERATAARPVPDPPARPSLVRAGRLVTLAGGTVGDLHFRVRPELRDVARARLADHGIDLDDPAEADEAARRCGPVLWDIVRPDRPVPDDRGRSALHPADLPELIAHLEAL